MAKCTSFSGEYLGIFVKELETIKRKAI